MRAEYPNRLDYMGDDHLQILQTYFYIYATRVQVGVAQLSAGVRDVYQSDNAVMYDTSDGQFRLLYTVSLGYCTLDCTKSDRRAVRPSVQYLIAAKGVQ